MNFKLKIRTDSGETVWKLATNNLQTLHETIDFVEGVEKAKTDKIIQDFKNAPIEFVPNDDTPLLPFLAAMSWWHLLNIGEKQSYTINMLGVWRQVTPDEIHAMWVKYGKKETK